MDNVNAPMKEWAQHPEFPDHDISDAGDVRNRVTGKLKTPRLIPGGRWAVHFWKNQKQFSDIPVADCVWAAHVGSVPKFFQVVFIDGDTANHHLSNLRCAPRMLPIEGEEWRAICGYEGIYEVSNKGRVRRSTDSRSGRAGDEVKGFMNDGYWRVMLSRNGKKKKHLVHILVCEAFSGSAPREGFQVNHIDTDTLNNFAENLEWVTPAQNRNHASENGCYGKHRNPHREEIKITVAAKRQKVTDDQAREIRSLQGLMSHKEIANRFGISAVNVGHIVNRRTFTHIQQETL